MSQLFGQSAGRAGVNPPPSSLRFHPAWLGPTYTITIRQHRTAPYLTVPYTLPPLPFVCSDVIFLFLGERQRERERYSWFFLFDFSLPELYNVPAIASSSFPALLAGYNLPARLLLSFVKAATTPNEPKLKLTHL